MILFGDGSLPAPCPDYFVVLLLSTSRQDLYEKARYKEEWKPVVVTHSWNLSTLDVGAGGLSRVPGSLGYRPSLHLNS